MRKLYGSDISENGINYTQKLLESNGLKATLEVVDMTDNPFTGLNFNGAISWDALHHNTISNINKAVNNVYENLCVGGMFMVSLLSTKGGAFHIGKEIEKNTFVREEGSEAGVSHYYFDGQGIRDLFKKWKIVSLIEVVVTYIETELDYLVNPFPYTKWNVIVQK
ncbi:MAG: class I SAM-dependent methyltransferase [Ruminiclostridium sp.]